MRRGMPYVPSAQKEVEEDEEHQAAEASRLSVGARCEVNPGGKRGCIRCAPFRKPAMHVLEWAS